MHQKEMALSKATASENRRALITGGAGFIGTHLTRALLREGYRVCTIDNEATGDRANVPSDVDYIPGDVRRMDDLGKAFAFDPTVVFHLAAQVSNIKSFENPQSDLDVNVVGTLNVLQLCIKHRVRRILHASSMALYGQPQTLPVSEQHPCQPESYYGVSKLAAEGYVRTASANPEFPLDFTAFRMFNVYGPLQSLSNPYQGVVSVFISNVLDGEPITIYGSGEQTRDFVYIGDVVRAWVGAVGNEAACGRVINLGSGAEVSILDLMRTTVEAFDRDPDEWPVQWGPRLFGDQDHIRCDNTLAGDVLGWQPNVPFADGLRRTVEWAKAAQ